MKDQYTGEKKRELYLDGVKGVAILLVILGHMNRFFTYEGRMNQMVYSVQLPLFLILGGYLLRIREGESFPSFVSRKFYRLMQPYFAFAFVSIIYAWPADAARFCFYLAGMLWGIGINDYLPNLPLWFLPMFFVANCWFCLILKASELGKRPWQRLGLMCLGTAAVMAAGWKIKQGETRLPWSFELAMILQGFFLAGYLWRLVKEWAEKTGRLTRRFMTGIYLLAVPAVFLWAVCVKMNGRVDINGSWFGNAGLFSFYLAAFAGSYVVIGAVWGLCRLGLPGKILGKALALFGENSMVIMAVHMPVLTWMDGVITPLMPQIIKANFMTKNLIGVGYNFLTIALLSLFGAMILKRPAKEKR